MYSFRELKHYFHQKYDMLFISNSEPLIDASFKTTFNGSDDHCEECARFLSKSHQSNQL